MTELNPTTSAPEAEPAAPSAQQPAAPKIVPMYEAFIKAQSEFDPVVKNRENPAFKGSKYADLACIIDACRPALNRNGFALIQQVENISQGNLEGISVETILIYRTGERISSGKLFMPITPGAKSNAAQALGSARTYACRYSISSFLGIAADDDDDGNAAGTPGDYTHKQQPMRRTQPQQTQSQQDAKPAVLTQALVDEGHEAAQSGMAGYQAFWKAQPNEIRKALTTSGWHEKLKNEAKEADGEANAA